MSSSHSEPDGQLVNTILIFEEGGVVKHRFCTEAQGAAVLKHAAESLSGGSMLTSDGMDAETVYAVSPDLRNRVTAAKDKLRSDLRIRDALNKHGVPLERELRTSIYKAFTELRAQWVSTL